MHFCTYLVTDKDYFWHQNDDCEFWQYVLHVRLYALSLVIPIGGWVNFSEGEGEEVRWNWGGGGGGVVKKKESPDFRSPEVNISVEVWATYQLFTEVEVARGDIYNCREAAR